LREVSDSARVSLGYLSEVERGRKEASSELLSAICAALDVAPGSLEAWLDDGVLRVEGDRWVRTYSREALESLLRGWRWELLEPSHYICSGPFEAAAGELGIAEVEALEARLRTHPIAASLHRAWTGIAVYNG
jgi:transcriptional regulator with XRE-family HTH domain